MKVSVIVPLYNKEKYIDDCIKSVLKQSYKNFELLIINNGSTDNGFTKAKKYKDKRIKFFEIKKKSVALARNYGIKKSTGKYITFLDADDYWDKDKLKKQIDFIATNNYAFIFCGYTYVNEDKTIKKTIKVPDMITYNNAIKNTTISTITVMLNMNKLTKDDIYMPDICHGEDTYTWWQILKKGYNAYSINESLAYYRQVKNSISSNKIVALKRTYNIYKMEFSNYIKRLIYYFCYIINAIKRRL